MNGHETSYSAAAADRILGGLLGGRRLSAVCDDEGLPPSTVLRWVQDDREGFSARYLQAHAAGRAVSDGRWVYTSEVAELILEELCEGRTLTDICGDPGMPPVRAVARWVRDDREGFKARYRDARETGCLTMADQVIDIADDSRNDWVARRNQDGSIEVAANEENLKRSGLRCAMRRWRLSKAMPKMFGDRLTLEAEPEARSDLAELMKRIDGQSRGLPSQWLPNKVDDG